MVGKIAAASNELTFSGHWSHLSRLNLPRKRAEMRLAILEAVEPRHIVYAVTDGRCMPLVRPGEVLVIEDAPRSLPEEGQWLLMQWISDAEQSRLCCRDRVGQTIGIPRRIKDDKWAYHPPCSGQGGMAYFGDGLFSWEQMINYIRGPVVGIYRPR